MKYFLIGLLVSFNTYALDRLYDIQTDNCNLNPILKVIPNDIERINNIHLAINRIAYDMRVNPCLILSMVWTESTFKPSQTSYKGANGLTQLMPRTRAAMIKLMGSDLNKAITSHLDSKLSANELEDLIIGTFYYKKLMKRFNNSDHAIMAYNRGPTWISINIKPNQKIIYDYYLNKVKGNLKLVTFNK